MKTTSQDPTVYCDPCNPDAPFIEPQCSEIYFDLARRQINSPDKVDIDTPSCHEHTQSPASILFQILNSIPTQADYIHYELLETSSLPHLPNGAHTPKQHDSIQQRRASDAQYTSSIPKYNGDLRRFLDGIASLPLADYPPTARTISFSLPTDTLCQAGYADLLSNNAQPEAGFEIHPPSDTTSRRTSEYLSLIQQFGTAGAIPTAELIRMNLDLLSVSFSVDATESGVEPSVINTSDVLITEVPSEGPIPINGYEEGEVVEDESMSGTTENLIVLEGIEVEAF